MDNQMESIIDDLECNILGLDDAFAFKCRTCGRCCKNRDDILLTTRDLYNIAHTLGKTMEDVVKQYCKVHIGQHSRIPVVRLRPVGAEQVCPLLRDKRCSVHTAKPVICALYPLGRAILVHMPEDGVEWPEKIVPTYVLQSNICGNRNHTHTVRSWLEQFGIPVEDEFYVMWTKLLAELTGMILRFEAAHASEKILQHIWEAVFAVLYVNCDAEKELIPQFQENTSALMSILKSVEEELTRCGGLRYGA